MTNRLNVIACAGMLVTIVSTPLWAADGVSSRDKAFMQKAARAGIAEIEAGKVAASQGSREDVKKFADQMVRDHGKAGEELSQLAIQKKITISSDADARHRTEVEKLKQMSGRKFDDLYIADAGIKDHQAAVKLFQDEAKNGRDPDVKAFAQKTLPTVEAHLAMVKEMAESK